MATLVVEFDDVGGGLLLRTLREYGHRLRTVRLGRGESLPADLDDLGAIVLCGGPDDPNGMPSPLVPLLEAAAAQDLPIVATGRGAVALAVAFGGGAAASPRWGWQDVRLTPAGREDAVFAGVAWSSRQCCDLEMGVASLPSGGKALANFLGSGGEGGDGAIAAWSRGLRTYAFAYRPELDLRLAQERLAGRREASAAAEQTAACLPDAERLAKRVFESIALFVAPLDRANKGLVKDLHY
jgi:GMP synthase-like glutamine amidotransferase